MDKLNFLKNEFPAMLRKLDANAAGSWGKMNAQQMAEHMADSFRVATGKEKHALHTPSEQVGAYKSFAMSDREFKPETKNALMAETPVPVRHKNMGDAVAEMEAEFSDFEHYFKSNPGATLTNPFFGDLNFDEWVHLFHKHAVHHCKQFGLL